MANQQPDIHEEDMLSVGTPSDDELSSPYPEVTSQSAPIPHLQHPSGVTSNLGGSCYSPKSTAYLRARKLSLERRINLQSKRKSFPRLKVAPEIYLTPELKLRWEMALENTSQYLNSLLVAQLTAELESVSFRLRGKENEPLSHAFENLRVGASTPAEGQQGGLNIASVENPSRPTPPPRPLMSIPLNQKPNPIPLLEVNIPYYNNRRNHKPKRNQKSQRSTQKSQRSTQDHPRRVRTSPLHQATSNINTNTSNNQNIVPPQVPEGNIVLPTPNPAIKCRDVRYFSST